MFNETPKEYSSPMAEKDHPELDTTAELGPETSNVTNLSLVLYNG